MNYSGEYYIDKIKNFIDDYGRIQDPVYQFKYLMITVEDPMDLLGVITKLKVLQAELQGGLIIMETSNTNITLAVYNAKINKF